VLFFLVIAKALIRRAPNWTNWHALIEKIGAAVPNWALASQIGKKFARVLPIRALFANLA